MELELVEKVTLYFIKFIEWNLIFLIVLTSLLMDWCQCFQAYLESQKNPDTRLPSYKDGERANKVRNCQQWRLCVWLTKQFVLILCFIALGDDYCTKDETKVTAKQMKVLGWVTEQSQQTT